MHSGAGGRATDVVSEALLDGATSRSGSITKAASSKVPAKQSRRVDVPLEPVDMDSIGIGAEIAVLYGNPRAKKRDSYTARVMDIFEGDDDDEEDGGRYRGKKKLVYIHYRGWNNRYDEWVDAARITGIVSLEESGLPQCLPTPSYHIRAMSRLQRAKRPRHTSGSAGETTTPNDEPDSAQADTILSVATKPAEGEKPVPSSVAGDTPVSASASVVEPDSLSNKTESVPVPVAAPEPPSSPIAVIADTKKIEEEEVVDTPATLKRPHSPRSAVPCADTAPAPEPSAETNNECAAAAAAFAAAAAVAAASVTSSPDHPTTLSPERNAQPEHTDDTTTTASAPAAAAAVSTSPMPSPTVSRSIRKRKHSRTFSPATSGGNLSSSPVGPSPTRRSKKLPSATRRGNASLSALRSEDDTRRFLETLMQTQADADRQLRDDATPTAPADRMRRAMPTQEHLLRSYDETASKLNMMFNPFSDGTTMPMARANRSTGAAASPPADNSQSQPGTAPRPTRRQRYRDRLDQIGAGHSRISDDHYLVRIPYFAARHADEIGMASNAQKMSENVFHALRTVYRYTDKYDLPIDGSRRRVSAEDSAARGARDETAGKSKEADDTLFIEGHDLTLPTGG